MLRAHSFVLKGRSHISSHPKGGGVWRLSKIICEVALFKVIKNERMGGGGEKYQKNVWDHIWIAPYNFLHKYFLERERDFLILQEH